MMIALGHWGVSMRTAFVGLLCAATVAGCVTTETVQFQPKGDQQAITRDGVPGLVSTRKDLIVIARPAARQFQIGGRPVFVLAIYNRGRTPQEFRVANVAVTQSVNGNDAQLQVLTYEQLASEERTRQTIAAIGVGLAAAGNAMSASQAGYLQCQFDCLHPSWHVSSSHHWIQPGSGGNSSIKCKRTNMRR